jgi:hypothetical protein
MTLPDPNPYAAPADVAPGKRPGVRRQWEGPVGLALVAFFIVSGMPILLFATVTRLGIGHILFVVITTVGFAVAISGFRRGNWLNRILSILVLLFFTLVTFLLYLRGHS